MRNYKRVLLHSLLAAAFACMPLAVFGASGGIYDSVKVQKAHRGRIGSGAYHGRRRSYRPYYRSYYRPYYHPYRSYYFYRR